MTTKEEVLLFKRISIILALFAMALAGIFASVALADKPPHPDPPHGVTCPAGQHHSDGKPTSDAPCVPNGNQGGNDCQNQGKGSGGVDQGGGKNGCGTTTTVPTTTETTTTAVTTTVPTTTSTPSTTTRVTTTVPTTTSTPGTTTGSTTGTTTTPAVVPSTNGGNSPGATQAPGVTKKSLQAKLKKQAAQPGTGRTSNASAPGELSNTGFPVWIGILLGVLMLGSGMVIRKRV
jgi:hypothetical protein